MIFGSLFSGIEAASVAWLPLGWRCAWMAEIDPFASAVLRHHYPNVPNLGDVNRIDPDAIEPVDLVVGGPPCQDFSVAGQRAGHTGSRGNLSLAYVRALDAIDPVWSLTENVPGWLSVGDNAFGRFLAAMVGSGALLIPRRGQRWTDAGLVAGPKRTAAWRVLDAQFHGVPQRRRRVFVLAVRGAGNWACAKALFPQQQSVPRNFAPRREAGERVAPSLTVGTHDCGGHQYRQRGNEDALITTDLRNSAVSDVAMSLQGGGMGEERGRCINALPHVLAFSGNNTTAAIDVATAVRAKGGTGHGDFESETFIAHSLRADGFDASEDGTGRGTPLIAMPIKKAHGSSGNGARRNAVNGADGDPMFTLDRDSQHAVQSGMSVRRLTPVECERLQGFPDNFTLVPYRGKPAADGNRYRAIGNSMAVPVIRWLGSRIQLVEDTITELSDAAE